MQSASRSTMLRVKRGLAEAVRSTSGLDTLKSTVDANDLANDHRGTKIRGSYQDGRHR